MTTPIDYGSTDCRRRWPCRALLGAAALLLTVGTVPGIAVRQVESRVDAVTGSMTWKTVWLFGLSAGTRVDVSPLETRLKQSGIPWTPDWRFLHNTHRNVFGGATCYECGSAPPIYRLRPVLGEFTAASTDDELRAFVLIMETATEEEQRAAVDAAGEEGLSWLKNAPGR